MSLDALWLRLGKGDALPRGEFQVLETLVAVPAGPILIALDAMGCRHLLAPIAAIAPIAEDRTSRGIHLFERVLEEGATKHRFLDLACRNPRWNSLFAVLADEMLAELQHVPSPPRAWRAVLAKWRALLDQEPPLPIGREALIGLFGELWILRKLLESRSDATSLWRGPLGDRHDFRSLSVALEVKSTARREGWEAEIHGDMQLLSPDGGSLYLVFLRCEEDPRGECVPDLVGDAQRLSGMPFLLNRLLAGIGYNSADDAEYNNLRLQVKDMRTYTVNDAFPRIVPPSFALGKTPDRVSNVRYKIDLADLPHDSVSDVLDLLVREGEL